MLMMTICPQDRLLRTKPYAHDGDLSSRLPIEDKTLMLMMAICPQDRLLRTDPSAHYENCFNPNFKMMRFIGLIALDILTK